MANGNPSLAEWVAKFFKELRKKPISPQEIKVADEFFERLKSIIIEEILEDPISQELINHTNPSQILGISRGTLFGFLGLPAGSEPMKEIVQIIQEKMKYKLSKRLVRGGYKMTVTIPTIQDFRAPNLILPWEGGYSIVEAIEKGVSGLGYYIYSMQESGNSRSGEGVQATNRIRNKEFQRRGWISNVLRNVKNLAKTF